METERGEVGFEGGMEIFRQTLKRTPPLYMLTESTHGMGAAGSGERGKNAMIRPPLDTRSVDTRLGVVLSARGAGQQCT